MAKQLHVSHVKSSVLNKVPAATAVTFGEIAVNYNPGSPALYIKNASNGMVKFSPQTYVDENFVHSAEYYSSGSTHEIRFKNASGTTLSTVNADDFIKDGMVSDVYVTTARTMVITFNTDAGHEDIELALSDIFDPDIYYTKDEIDDAELAIAASLNDLNDRKADKSYVDDAISASTIEIDDMLDSGSTNPVENRVIYQALEDSKVTVDSTLSTASTNPVQNKVVYQYILDNELVAAAAINSLNDRKSDKSYVNSNFVNDVEYYSSGSTHEIRFKDVSGNTIATVNANDFIKDGMVHDVYLTGSTMVITFNTDAGQEDIELDITDIFDPDLYYTKDEIDGTLSGYTTTSDLTTLLAGKQPLIDSQHKLDYSLLDNTPTIPTVESMTAQEVSTAVASAWTTVFGS